MASGRLTAEELHAFANQIASNSRTRFEDGGFYPDRIQALNAILAHIATLEQELAQKHRETAPGLRSLLKSKMERITELEQELDRVRAKKVDPAVCTRLRPNVLKTDPLFR